MLRWAAKAQSCQSGPIHPHHLALLTLDAKRANVFEMIAVDMEEDANQPSQDALDDILKVFGKWHANLAGEKRLVIQLPLDPRHEAVDVIWCRHLGRFAILERGRILPVVLKTRAGGHRRALEGNTSAAPQGNNSCPNHLLRSALESHRQSCAFSTDSFRDSRIQ